MNELLGDQWLEHMREAWIWMRDRFIPYPLQNNIHLLPKEDLSCVERLRDLASRPPALLENFHDWINASFGVGMAEILLLPYNFKVWAHQPATMSYGWVGERVATVDLQRILANAQSGKVEKSWGPNNRFRFPSVWCWKLRR